MLTTKRPLMTSVIALILCFSMLLGTTFAWFTDSAISGNNVIQSGNLDVEMYWSDKLLAADSDEWQNADGKPIFTYDKWEPGYTEIRYIKVKNAGSLALQWRLFIEAEGAVGELAEVIQVYYVNPVTSEATNLHDLTSVGVLTDVLNEHKHTGGVLLPAGATSTEHTVGETILAVAFHMDENAGNQYQGKSVGDGFAVNLIATQFTYENDAFGDKYDELAQWPNNVVVGGNSASATVVPDANNKVSTAVAINSNDGKISATVPAGVKLASGTNKLTLSVNDVADSKANIVLNETEASMSIDVHMNGVAADNDVVMAIAIKELLPKGLNMGNYRFYHVEGGKTVEMTLLANGATAVHNNFEYDPATGDVVMYLKSFSEIALVADKENAWEGEFDYSWYTNAVAPVDGEAVTEYIIANADQLAAFGAIVGGMAKDKEGNFLITYTDSDGDVHHNDSFSGKYVKLIANINLGDDEENNVEGKIFYPIGYWNNEGTYERLPADQRVNAVSSGFYAFEGTFDGNGNTIANFYQNTWEMKGDHDWYDVVKEQYFRDGFGLFGKVYGGTIKNLTVDNFSCDSEIGTTGVIAAYADSKNGQPALFENITITNCNPRVYNIGNGGIVGCAGWYSRNDSLYKADYANAVTFRNITVDQTNKISALWGSWGVSCAGILGQYYPNSACGIKLENCHVAAIIDVNNDVCSNYQYYWYRYAGMFIGTIRANTKDANGYEIADTTGVTAKDCTYTMGNWNEYWYCEIVANSLASYTHDHQFSRLTNITDISEIQNADGTWKTEGHFALLSADRKSVECYHIFKDSNGKLYQHFHDVADESNPNIYEDFDLDGNGKLDDLKEDRQRYFIPFNQLLTGLDMGIKAHTEFEGITFVEDGTVKSEEKFESIVTNGTYKPGQTIKIGELVEAKVDESMISKATLYAAASPAVGNGNTKVNATYSLDAGNWRNSSITFGEDCSGAVKIVITDYFYCTPTVIVLNEALQSPKFDAATVGAQNAYTQITLGDLFTVKNGVTIGNVTATVIDPNGNENTLTGTSSDWTTKTIDLTKDGNWTVAIQDDDKYCAATDVTFTVNSIDKFQGSNLSYEHTLENDIINVPLGDIFTARNDTTINNSDVNVQLSNDGAECVYTKNESDWKNATLAFTGTGSVTITITDNNACNAATATVTISTPAEKDVFAKKFTNENFTYRVGNGNAIKIGSLFSATNLASGATVSINIVRTTGNVGATYTENSTWSNGEIKFTGTGVVVVTIDSNAFTKAVELTLEVVDAVNATSATHATSNNVVLLNDCGFSSLEVSGGYTLFGNGFTMTCGSDSAALDTGYAFVTLDNGTLDNVQIDCPDFDYAVLYSSNMKDSGNRAETTDKTRYFNVKSGVMVSGNSQILNSRISGARAAVNVSGGNCVIDNSRIEGGAVASVLVGAANSVTLRDVTLIQKPTESTYKGVDGKSPKTLMGFSVLFICDSNGDAAPMTLEGTLTQQAWVDESDKQYVPSAGQSIVSTVLAKTEYLHDIDGDGKKESLNLGFAYMPESLGDKVNGATITDNRTNKNDIPYDYADVYVMTTQTYVYSYKNTSGTNGSFVNVADYVPNKYSDIVTVNYSDTADGLTTGKSYGTDGWVYELNVDLDKLSGYKLNFSKLTMSVNGVAVTDFKVDGNAKPASPVEVTAGGATYTLTAIVNGKECTVYYKVIGTETSKESPSKLSGPTANAFGVAKSYGGDWSGAANVLEGIKIKYWSVADKTYKEIDFSNFTVPGNAGKLNGANSYWEYTAANNDYTLKVTNTVAIHSGKKVFGMPIRGTDGKLYFTISSTDGYVGTGTTSRSITMQYEFTDNNGGEKLTFTHTFNVSYSKDEQYSYSDLVNSGELTKLANSGGSGGCVTGDSMVTLADGTQKRIDQVTYNDQLLVWDFFKGEYAVVPATLVVNHGDQNWNVIRMEFEDGTVVKVVTAHAFFDADLNDFVLITPENAQEYVGHSFVKATDGSYTTAKLIKCTVSKEYTGSYSLVSAYHYNFIVENMFSLTNSVHALIAGVEVGDNMKYDETVLASDIEKYGLYTYEDFAEYVTYEQFIAFNGPYLKISVGKGYITFEQIIELINTYVNP